MGGRWQGFEGRWGDLDQPEATVAKHHPGPETLEIGAQAGAAVDLVGGGPGTESDIQ